MARPITVNTRAIKSERATHTHKGFDELIAKFNKLGYKDMKHIIRKACTHAGLILMEETRRELKSVLPSTDESYTKGVMISHTNDKFSYNEPVNVHILGVRSKTKGASEVNDWKLRFLEQGNYLTQPRKTKGTHYQTHGQRKTDRLLPEGLKRGNIKAYNFFSNARTRVNSAMRKGIDTSITNSINDIFNK